MSAPIRRVETLIVGAGFAGIAMAIALNRADRGDYLVVERAGSVGGTWRENTYPGIACDVPAHLYGFATHPDPAAPTRYAAGADIQRYLDSVAAVELAGHVRFDAPMTDARWDESSSRWRIEAGGPIEADVLVLACGRLTDPVVPDVPGLAKFDGPVFHSSRWNHTAALDGARVAVIGTGASAVQLVPPLAERSRVTLFQRSAAWIVPRGDRAYSAAELRRFAADPDALAAERRTQYLEGEARFASRSGDPDAAAAARGEALAHLAAQVSDPALRRALTPDYAFGCKRVLLSDDFYPALASDRVALVPAALASVDARTLVAENGSRHEVDAVVLATGFASNRQPYAGLVRAGAQTLAEHWRDGMTAFASTAVAGFPNLFVLDGPNASLGHNSSVLIFEEQAGYVVRALAERDRRGGAVLRVRPEAEAAYTAEIAAAAASTPWLTGGCRNWYTLDGRLTLLWPGTVSDFRERLAAADGSEFEPEPACVLAAGSAR